MADLDLKVVVPAQAPSRVRRIDHQPRDKRDEEPQARRRKQDDRDQGDPALIDTFV